jgi:hypothetical protein
VRYVFRNNTGHDIDATVAFPLSEVNGGDLENVPMHLPSKDPINFVDFKISVDGRPVQPSVEVGATFKKKDITDRLAGLGLPIAVADKLFETALARLSRAQQTKLEKDNWVECDEGQPRRCGAYWSTRVQYY